MNYRHHFHAGNFADVFKHVVLLQLLRGMQRKEKGFLYLDTHAGRGRYDLSQAGRGDTQERMPEHPDGIERLWTRANLLPPLSEYVSLVRDFNRQSGNMDDGIVFYPGSPLLAVALARSQDRLALCELQRDDLASLQEEFAGERCVSVHDLDGYRSIRAMLPPLEKRALILIDPPFEEKEEFERIVDALADGLKRSSGGTFVIWYPLTERARIDAFFDELLRLPLPATFTAELTVAGDDSPIKMKGCGLLVINPPWQIDRVILPILAPLAELLAQAPGGSGRLQWLVPE